MGPPNKFYKSPLASKEIIPCLQAICNKFTTHSHKLPTKFVTITDAHMDKSQKWRISFRKIIIELILFQIFYFSYPSS